MKNSVFALIASVLFLASCNSGGEGMSQSEFDAKVDSLVGIKLEEVNRQAMEDRERRIAIEVKAKADSIVAAVTGK